jgi:hypothetical protein
MLYEFETVRSALHGPGGTVAVEGAHAMVFNVVPMVASADRPLIDVLLGVPGIKLQPVGSIFLPYGETRAHPPAADVVIHSHKFAVLQTGLKLVVARRPRETRRARRLAGLDQLDRATDFLGAVRRDWSDVVTRHSYGAADCTNLEKAAKGTRSKAWNRGRKQTASPEA